MQFYHFELCLFSVVVEFIDPILLFFELFFLVFYISLLAHQLLFELTDIEFVPFDHRVILFRQLVDFAFAVGLPLDFIGLHAQYLFLS